MGMGQIPSLGSLKISCGIMTALTYAVLEWMLIFMLFIGAIFSYLVTKFAHYCALQIPCLLCSRLDHIFGDEKDGFCWDLICSKHKLDISSLTLCHVHNKLVGIHELCETCYSRVKIYKSSANTYGLLVDKFDSDSQLGLDHDPLLQCHDHVSSVSRKCSCCNEQWMPRSYSKGLLQTRTVNPEATELGIPLSAATDHNCDDLKKIKEKSPDTRRFRNMQKNVIDPLSHVEYRKVNITSDTESEVSFSEGEDAIALIPEPDDQNYEGDDPTAQICETNNLKEDISVQCMHLGPHIINLTDDSTSEKLILPTSVPKPSFLKSQVEMEIDNAHVCTSVASTAAIGHGLEELNWHQIDYKKCFPAPSKLSSSAEVPPSSNLMENPVEVSRETLSEDLAPGKVKPQFVAEREEISKVGSEPIVTSKTGIDLNHFNSDTGLQMPNYLDLVDAYKIAVGNRGRQLSGKPSEQRSVKDSARVSEDLKLLLSQISGARGIELSLTDMSPRLSVNSDELKASDTCSSIGMQILQKRISLERNESGLSLDGSIVSEIDGESVIDRLKRQIEHDRKLMGTLYKELEEERNASAIAASQAMAMITRLQEEKAKINMEALQCLRMMEEQAEYDVEAVQKADNLLAEKEKEIQDLQSELECYRNKYGMVPMVENILEPTCDWKAGDVQVPHSDSSFVSNSVSVPWHCTNNKFSTCSKIERTAVLAGDKGTDTANNSLSEFENERLHILQCLKNLEKKLELFSNDGVYLDVTNGENFAEEEHILRDLKERDCKGFHENCGTEERRMQKDASLYEESAPSQEGCTPSFEKSDFISNKNSESDCGVQGLSVICKDSDLLALRNEVSVLNGRLEALEADRKFLDYSFGTLRNGDEGLKFIQDIACQLRELRRLGIKKSF